ncbi:MAG: FMN-binding protein [Ruminococcus sp.]|nr:FMN-binding protein [Ruminococcus sp.]
MKNNSENNIKPTLVLTVICVIASVLLVFAYELTKDKIAQQKEQRFSTSVESLFGKTDSRLIDGNFGNDDIEAIAVTTDGKTAVHVCTDGYSKDGINILVGIDENGAVSGIEFVSLGETPGLGSKVRDIPDFRRQFYGESEYPVDVDAVSGATFSSRGMQKAVSEALEVYNTNKEAILNG